MSRTWPLAENSLIAGSSQPRGGTRLEPPSKSPAGNCCSDCSRVQNVVPMCTIRGPRGDVARIEKHWNQLLASVQTPILALVDAGRTIAVTGHGWGDRRSMDARSSIPDCAPRGLKTTRQPCSHHTLQTDVVECCSRRRNASVCRLACFRPTPQVFWAHRLNGRSNLITTLFCACSMPNRKG